MALGITCDAPPEGVVGTPYSHFFPATSGTPPYSFAITAGALPDGLSLDIATGEASGTPTLAGTFTFTVQVTDHDGATADVECTIDIAASALDITCDNPPVGVVGTAYSHFFPATGGVPPYTFSLFAGAFPDGLTIDAGTGELSGVPTVPGIFSFTVEVADDDGATAFVECSITINDALEVICDTPPDGIVGTAYSHFFPATGGVPPYTFSISAGALPDGLSINPATGEVSGIPTLIGTFGFTVHVVDSYGGRAPDTADVECSITIDPAELLIFCDNPPVGFVGVPYSHAFPVGGGVAPYTFFIIGGMIPPGLGLGAGTGIISGVPTIKGVYTFTIQVIDALDSMAQVECSITIRSKCLLDNVI